MSVFTSYPGRVSNRSTTAPRHHTPSAEAPLRRPILSYVSDPPIATTLIPYTSSESLIACTDVRLGWDTSHGLESVWVCLRNGPQPLSFTLMPPTCSRHTVSSMCPRRRSVYPTFAWVSVSVGHQLPQNTAIRLQETGKAEFHSDWDIGAVGRCRRLEHDEMPGMT